MCMTPNRLPDGTQAACRRCKLCLTNRTNDLVGRAIAESRVSDLTLSVTLTYAGDSVKNVVHCYEDVQKMIRAQRDAGIKVRYMIAGEFGETFGRVHWHCVLFWRGSDLPQVELERRINWAFWPHGYSYFQQPDYGGLAYALKYAVKDAKPGTVNPFQPSKKPPIGHDYFVAMAHDIADKGLPLHDPSYSFADVTYKGKTRQFWLQGRMREIYVKAYLDRWAFNRINAEYDPGPVPQTPWLFGNDEIKGFYWKLYPEATVSHQLQQKRFNPATIRKRSENLRSEQQMINEEN